MLSTYLDDILLTLTNSLYVIYQKMLEVVNSFSYVIGYNIKCGSLLRKMFTDAPFFLYGSELRY